MASIHPVKVSIKVRRYWSFLCFPRLATIELVEGLVEKESAVGVCLRANGAGLLDLTDSGLEAPGVKQGFQGGEKGLGAYV
jgi:hypothetical protein